MKIWLTTTRRRTIINDLRKLGIREEDYDRLSLNPRAEAAMLKDIVEVRQHHAKLADKRDGKYLKFLAPFLMTSNVGSVAGHNLMKEEGRRRATDRYYRDPALPSTFHGMESPVKVLDPSQGGTSSSSLYSCMIGKCCPPVFFHQPRQFCKYCQEWARENAIGTKNGWYVTPMETQGGHVRILCFPSSALWSAHFSVMVLGPATDWSTT